MSGSNKEKGAGEIKNATSTEVRHEFSDTLNRVAYSNETVLIERRGRPIAALISYRAFTMLQNVLERLEERLDAADLEASATDELLDFDLVVKELADGRGATSARGEAKRGKGVRAR